MQMEKLKLANVDPFIIQWPRKWLEDQEIGPVIVYLNRFLHDLFLRTGGGNDEIAATAVREVYPWDYSDNTGSDSVGVSSLFNSLIPEVKQFRNFTVTGGSYTALDRDFINGKANALIYFPKYPPINATFTVRNGDGSQISLNGNGKMLNGCSTGIIDNQETCIDWHYFIDSDEWFAK